MDYAQKKKNYDISISNLIKDCGFEDTPYLHTTIKKFLSIHRDIPLQKLQGILLGAAAISRTNNEDKLDVLKKYLQYAYQTSDRHILDELMNILSHIKYAYNGLEKTSTSSKNSNTTPIERIAEKRAIMRNFEDIMQSCLAIANKRLRQSTISLDNSIDDILQDTYNIISIYQSLLKHLPQGEYTSSTGKTFREIATQVITERLSRLSNETLRAISKESGKELDELFTEMKNPNNICHEAFSQEEIQSMVQNVTTLITWGNVSKFNLTASAINDYITKITEMAKKENIEVPELSTKDIIIQTTSLMQQARNLSYGVSFLLGNKMGNILNDKTIKEKENEHLEIVRDIFPNLQLQGMTTAHHIDTITNRPSILKNLSPQIIFNQTISLMDSIFLGLGQTLPKDIKKGSIEEKVYQRDTLKELGFDIEKIYHADNIPNIFSNLIYPKFKDTIISNFATLSQFLPTKTLQNAFSHNSNLFISNPDKLKEDIKQLTAESKSKDQLMKKLHKYLNGDFLIFTEPLKKSDTHKENTGKPHVSRGKKDNNNSHDLIDIKDIDLDGLSQLTGMSLDNFNITEETNQSEIEATANSVSDETLSETYSNLLSELASLISVVKSILDNSSIKSHKTLGTLSSAASGMLNINAKSRMQKGVTSLMSRVAKITSNSTTKDDLPEIYQLKDYLSIASSYTGQLQQKLQDESSRTTAKTDSFYLQERKHKETARNLAKYKNMSIESIDAMLKLKDLSPITKKELLEIKKAKIQLQQEYEASMQKVKEGRKNGLASQESQYLADVNREIETIDILNKGLAVCMIDIDSASKRLTSLSRMSLPNQ